METFDIEDADTREDVQMIDEGKRLRFAGWLLGGIGALAAGVFAAYGWYPRNTALQQLFELVKIGLLPLATLVVSFYFARTDR